MEGCHQRNPQLLTQLRETKVKGGQRETGVDQIGFDPLKRVPKFPLCAQGGNCVHLGFHQVRQAHIWIVSQQRRRTPLRTEWGVEMNEMSLMAALAERLSGAQPVGDVPAEGRLLSKPCNLHQPGLSSSGDSKS
jgi:hypothetical protein